MTIFTKYIIKSVIFLRQLNSTGSLINVITRLTLIGKRKIKHLKKLHLSLAHKLNMHDLPPK